MREINDMPTVLQYAYQFPDAVEETLKRTTNSGFSYFTGRGSYYEVPENMVPFNEVPRLPKYPKQARNRGDLSCLRNWARKYGKSTRQLSVRSKSTKDNPGTLPISAYGRRALDNNPLMSICEIRESLAMEADSESSDSSDVSEDDCSNSEEDDCPAPKNSVLLISKDKRAQGVFLLGTLTREWRKASKDSARVHLYAPDQEDCLLLHYDFTGLVDPENVVEVLNIDQSALNFTDEEFCIEISDQLYDHCLSRVCVSKNTFDEAVCGDNTQNISNSSASSRGRALRLPHRYRL